jgi:hypothetical protein
MVKKIEQLVNPIVIGIQPKVLDTKNTEKKATK